MPASRAHEPHAVDVADDARGDEGRDLADRVSGDAAEARALGLAQLLPGEDARRDDEGLSDRGVANLVGIPFGARGDEVDARGLRVPFETLTRTRRLEPGNQEPRGLRTLSGESGNNHSIHSSRRMRAQPGDIHTRMSRVVV
jgi:hypothetical protein